jgi:hypothetical protein
MLRESAGILSDGRGRGGGDGAPVHCGQTMITRGHTTPGAEQPFHGHFNCAPSGGLNVWFTVGFL